MELVVTGAGSANHGDDHDHSGGWWELWTFLHFVHHPLPIFLTILTILLTINTSGNGSMESVTASPVDPLIVKTICEQLDVINKLLVKVIMMMTMTNKWNKMLARLTMISSQLIRKQKPLWRTLRIWTGG